MNVFTKSALALAACSGAALLPGLVAQNAQTGAKGPQTGVPGLSTGSQTTPSSAHAAPARAVSTVGSQGYHPVHEKFTDAQIENGGSLFLQNCAFCHGKDAGGGESGPDLTRSKLVSTDKKGEAISQVIHNGRPNKGMPAFNLADADVLSLVAFVHSQQDKVMSETGTRKGVDDSDLQTGNAAAGKAYFEDAGGCTQCHSATKDLAGIATRYQGLRLEQQMLYPRDVKEKITVKTSTGQTLTGTVDTQDEFTIAMTDSFGVHHSWPVSAVTFKVDDPLAAHVTAMSKYTDDDIHNVFAYIETLK